LEQAIENAMVEAQLGTNVSTVSACLQEHVGTRARKRKEAISLGVNAASERALREDYVVLIPTSAAGAVEAPSSGTSDHEAVPASTDSGEAASTGSASSARIGETPGSSATVVPAPRASHGKLFALVGATAGAGAGIVGVVMLVNREQPLARPGAALDVAPPAVTTSASGETGVEASAIAVTVTEGPTPGTGATEPPNLPPAIAVTDLPPAPPLPPAVGAPATPSALVIPMRTTSRPLSSARPTRQIKPRVNDGF
jgi:hypothetical protein